MVFSQEQGMLVLGEVSSRLNLPDDVVKRTLHSLSCGKYKVLKREGEGGSIKATDKVRRTGGEREKERDSQRPRLGNERKGLTFA